MVEADLGIGFVPEEFLEKWSNVCRIDLEEKIPERNVVVIKRKGQPLSVAAKELEKNDPRRRKVNDQKGSTPQMNCTPFVGQYGILFKKWRAFLYFKGNTA